MDPSILGGCRGQPPTRRPAPSVACLRTALLRNMRLQRQVAAHLSSKQVALRQTLDMLVALCGMKSTVAYDPTVPSDYASQKYRFQHHARDVAAQRHHPFRTGRGANEVPPLHPLDFEWVALFTHFPPPVCTHALELRWSDDLDDLLSSAVVSCGLEFSAAVRPEDEEHSAGPVMFGLSLNRWKLVAEFFNVAVETDCFLRCRGWRAVSPMDCILRYGNVLKCNRAEFGSAEDAIIVKHTAMRDTRTGGLRDTWPVISECVLQEIGHRRSAFQCASRFQRLLNATFIPPSQIHISTIIGEAKARDLVAFHGVHDSVGLCLALNNNFERSPASPEEGMLGNYWIPLARVASFATRTKMLMIDRQAQACSIGESMRLRQRVRTIASTTIALLAVCTGYFVPLAVGSAPSLSAMLHIINEKLAGSWNRSMHMLCEPVDFTDLIYAQEVCRERFGASTTLEECAKILRCHPQDVSNLVANAAVNSRSCSTIALHLFGNVRYAAVVRTLLLAHYLENPQLQEFQPYPARRVLSGQ